MNVDNNKKKPKAVWFVSIGVAFAFICVGLLTLKVLLSDDGAKRRRQIQMVTLVKPPPPPKIEEKPPEPEIEEKEEIIEPEPEETPPEDQNDAAADEAPEGDNLGLDADGTAGSDAFGLVGKKGGRALLAGSGDRTLMQRYAWYTRMIQERIRKKINDHMTSNGGIPSGDYKALVQIVLDNDGRIINYKLHELSGNEHVDKALKETLLAVHVGESPPEGMPKSIRLKVSSRG
jgi:outer membrane biosynthesis protein TonB